MATRLETDRLILRTYEAHDADAWIAMFSDPEVTRFIGSASRALPRTAETFRAQMAMRLELEEELGYAVWAVERNSTSQFIGQCGLRPASLMDPDAGSEIDLGYHFTRAYWGQGYATEAVAGTLAHGLGTVGLARVMAVVEPENIGSWRVTEKAGMRREGSASYYGMHDLKKYVAERDWWQPPTGSTGVASSPVLGRSQPSDPAAACSGCPSA